MNCLTPSRPVSLSQIKYDDEKITGANLREVIDSTDFKAVEEKTARGNQ